MIVFNYCYFKSNLKIRQVVLKGLRDPELGLPLSPSALILAGPAGGNQGAEVILLP